LWLNGAIRKTIFQKICDEITQQTISNWIMQKITTSESRQPFDVWQFVTSDAISMPSFGTTPFAAPRANLEKHHA